MKCECGEISFEPTMSAALQHKYLDGKEVAFFHNQLKCGWAVECMDCWGGFGGFALSGYFLTGLESEEAAIALLHDHLNHGCRPNQEARFT